MYVDDSIEEVPQEVTIMEDYLAPKEGQDVEGKALGYNQTVMEDRMDLDEPIATSHGIPTDGHNLADNVQSTPSEATRSCVNTPDGIENPTPGEVIEILVIPKDREISMMRGQVRKNLTILAAQSRRLEAIPPPTEENTRRLKDARAHLAWMSSEIEMTPTIRDKTRIKLLLDLILDDSTIHFPEDIEGMARDLYYKWTAEEWGIDRVTDGDVDAEDMPIGGTAQDVTLTQVALPSPGDPLYGSQGIMHGILVVRSDMTRRKVYRFNPHVPRTPANVFGHNGIPVGAWFAFQIVAHQRGAHGSSSGGIHGTLAAGAYSIVTSSAYKDLDRDEGDILYYSGSNSHDNSDPNRPAPSSNMTKALRVSYLRGKPVRVLRSAGANIAKGWNKYSPSCGIRYDGLYQITETLLPKNPKGGLYEQFKLVRLQGQPSLAQICESVPSWEQIAAFRSLHRSPL
ncbi:PUA-like domain-containing protein [Xylariales sp. PMI_506]|nr:PUA-like domain-containing protein [Xylariales sp. PMI_506]